MVTVQTGNKIYEGQKIMGSRDTHFAVFLWWHWFETGRGNCGTRYHQPSQQGCLLEKTFKPLLCFSIFQIENPPKMQTMLCLIRPSQITDERSMWRVCLTPWPDWQCGLVQGPKKAKAWAVAGPWTPPALPQRSRMVQWAWTRVSLEHPPCS